MRSKKLSAVVVERLLIACFVLVIGLLIADFIYFSSSLKSKAGELQEFQVSLNSINKDLKDIQDQEREITKNQSKIDKLKLLVGEIKEYQYQNQIIEDISGLIRAVDPKNGIASYAFSGAISPGTTTSTTPAPQTGQTTTPSPSATAATTPPGLDVIDVTITIDTINYDDYLRLIQLFENNVMRMQLKEVTLTPDAAKRSDTTKVTTLEKLQLVLTIYTRKTNGS